MRDPPAPILVVTGPSGAGKSTVSRLVASAYDKSAHVRADDVTFGVIVNGWVEPWLPESAHQNEVLGGAMTAAAMQFALGGYTVVVDGHMFPDGLEGMAEMCARRSVPLHYVVLRADLETCLARATSRGMGERPDPRPFAALHAKFVDLGAHEANVIEAIGPPEEVAAAVLAAFRSGRLVETIRPLSDGG
ncbi:MAG: AAA family ATPase [Acidimicrobiales bacterium]